MPFFTTLAGTDGHVDLVLAVRIEGIPVAFVERAIPAAVAISLTGYTQFVGITRIEEGEAMLDLEERREKAASLEFDLLDDSTRTLRALFAVNTRRTGYFTANKTTSDTSLSMSAVGTLANNQAIYTDSETIDAGTIGVGGVTGAGRGAYGSTSAAIFGTATAGDSYYTTPPNWVGRRAYLYGYTLDAAGGGDEELLGTWIVDEPPRCSGDDAWSMTLASVAQEFYERAIGFNLEEGEILSATTSEVGGDTVVDFTFTDANIFRTAAAWPSYLLVSWDSDVAAIYEMISTTSTTVRIRSEPAFGTLSPIDSQIRYNAYKRIAEEVTLVDWTTAKKARQIAIISGGTSGLHIPYLLRSNEGTGGSYDVLPGRVAASSDSPGWRMGAAFKSTEIDTTSFESLATGPITTILIDGERKVSEVLREWCYLTGTATRTTSDGRLSTFTLAPPRQVLTTTLDANSVVPDSRVEVTADEGALAALATVKIDYSPLSKEYRGTINLCDVDLSKRYGRAPRRREFEFRSFGCQDAARLVTGAAPFIHPTDLSVSEVPSIVADILASESGKARVLVRLSLTMAHLGLRIGDVVTLSGLPDAFSTLPDMQGGTLDGTKARVVARRPRYNDARVDVQLQILDPLLVVCPAAVIASAAGAALTLATTGPEVSGASPGNDFYINSSVRIHDISLGTSETRTVTARTSTTITLASAPTNPIQAGVDYVCFEPDFSDPGTTPSGYTLEEMATLTDDNELGGGPLFVSRWR